ncbi:Protein NRT1/ PTR FAMILY 4.4 [Zea mays]|uniref:Protein NRT1/ PTR FAMILY 4.4 n=1 Tax=Zea mays TaxID=4577 RepID=A0A1D6E9Z8_MAIZE|nr:Protein NRT1/ PTR FAMILY 4.4 [Zea mays]
MRPGSAAGAEHEAGERVAAVHGGRGAAGKDAPRRDAHLRVHHRLQHRARAAADVLGAAGQRHGHGAPAGLGLVPHPARVAAGHPVRPAAGAGTPPRRAARCPSCGSCRSSSSSACRRCSPPWGSSSSSTSRRAPACRPSSRRSRTVPTRSGSTSARCSSRWSTGSRRGTVALGGSETTTSTRIGWTSSTGCSPCSACSTSAATCSVPGGTMLAHRVPMQLPLVWWHLRLMIARRSSEQLRKRLKLYMSNSIYRL